MIGLDFPVKPAWIHAVHHLWQPEQPIGELIQLALAHAMPELGGQKTRHNSLTIILRYFVATQGGGQSRRTLAKDVWVSYSKTYPVNLMAPAYLAHLVTQNEVAQEIARFLTRRYTPGQNFPSAEVRRHVAATFGQRKVATNAASAFIRSLEAFGVLAPGQRKADYQFKARLPIAREIFPLIVWASWQAHPSPQIDLDNFAARPGLAFLQTEELSTCWAAYHSTLWSLDERLEGRRATLKYVEAEFFEEALLRLLPQS